MFCFVKTFLQSNEQMALWWPHGWNIIYILDPDLADCSKNAHPEVFWLHDEQRLEFLFRKAFDIAQFTFLKPGGRRICVLFLYSNVTR
jgi:hypothetical protein